MSVLKCMRQAAEPLKVISWFHSCSYFLFFHHCCYHHLPTCHHHSLYLIRENLEHCLLLNLNLLTYLTLIHPITKSRHHVRTIVRQNKHFGAKHSTHRGLQKPIALFGRQCVGKIDDEPLESCSDNGQLYPNRKLIPFLTK